MFRDWWKASCVRSTIEEAQKLAIEIIQDTGSAVRRRMEVAVFLKEGEERRMVRRVGIRVIRRKSKTVDSELMKVMGEMLNMLEEGKEIKILYIFMGPEMDARNDIDEALAAFLPASSKIMGHEV